MVLSLSNYNISEILKYYRIELDYKETCELLSKLNDEVYDDLESFVDNTSLNEHLKVLKQKSNIYTVNFFIFDGDGDEIGSSIYTYNDIKPFTKRYDDCLKLIERTKKCIDYATCKVVKDCRKIMFYSDEII